MRKSRFTEAQIIGMIKEQEAWAEHGNVLQFEGQVWRHGSVGCPPTSGQRRDAVLAVLGGCQISQRRACVLIGVDLETVRRERPPYHGAIRDSMREVAGKRRRFGYRRIGVML